MRSTSWQPVAYAIGAAVLFGASAPFAKLLLEGAGPVTLASLIYLGSGTGLFLYSCLRRLRHSSTEATLSRQDLPWLLGAIISGGVLAPIVLMISLEQTPAATAALLLNFEAVATAIIALLLFKEAIGRRIWWALGLITLASIILSWNSGEGWGISVGAAGVILACALWGVDNNLTAQISAKDPVLTVTIKGLVAGLFSLVLAYILHETIPETGVVAGAMLLGFLSYGVSIVLFIMALRGMGAARTGTLFAVSPFIGVIFSLLIYQEPPALLFWASLPLMAAGTWLLAGERHSHPHVHAHVIHEHRHRHDDLHHAHHHEAGEIPESGEHSHIHTHEMTTHDHPHAPDIHHRHMHEDGKIRKSEDSKHKHEE